MTTLLISDLHLQEERPDITRAFLLFLREQARQADALYILGDFFEAWIGDDGMDDYQRSIAAALHELSQTGTRIYLMHGNRDFLLGSRFCKMAGCTLLKDPTVTELAGEKVLLMHGDTLCTSDHAYMRMRRWLRNPLSLFILRHLPLTTRRRIARKLRSESRQQTRMKASDIVDVTAAEVSRVMSKYAVSTLIHGHTHRPAIHTLEINDQRARRIVLGDWDKLGWVLQASDGELQMESFPIPA